MRGKHKRRSGQIIVFGTAMALVLAAVAMLAIDVGYIFAHRALLQNASDGAALAALQVLTSQREGGATEPEARADAADEAVAIARANAPEVAVSTLFGVINPDGTFSPHADSVPATAVKAVVSRGPGAPGGTLPLFFGPFFGYNALDVSASAVASIGTSVCGVRANLSPFAVYEGDIPDLGDIMTFYPGDQDQLAPGCFGLLNLDGGSFGTPEVRDWILNGYDREFRIDPAAGYIWVDGGTGFRAAIQSAVEQRIGDQLIVAVYDQVTGTGHNADFRVVSFMGLTVTEARLTGNDKYIRGRVEYLTVTSDVIAGGSGSSPNLGKVQLVD